MNYPWKVSRASEMLGYCMGQYDTSVSKYAVIVYCSQLSGWPQRSSCMALTPYEVSTLSTMDQLRK